MYDFEYYSNKRRWWSLRRHRATSVRWQHWPRTLSTACRTLWYHLPRVNIVLYRTNIHLWKVSHLTFIRLDHINTHYCHDSSYFLNILIHTYGSISDNFSGLAIGTGGGQPLNGALPSLPSPTMPGFNMAAQTANGQPPPQDAVYTNGIHQTFTGRKYFCL